MNKNFKQDQHFKKYYSKLRAEALLKSLFFSGLISFSVCFTTALVSWFVYPVGFWIALALLLPGTIGLTAIIYFAKYRPNTMSNARRLDRLGLEERLITMIEYQDDDSFMAAAQREDAKATLEQVKVKDIRFMIPRKIITAASILATLALGMTVTNGLSYAEVIPTGQELFQEATEPESSKYVQARYRIKTTDAGYLLGEAEQYILRGGDAKIVIAIANDGFTFERWSDGVSTPARVDKALVDNLDVYAIFSEIDDPFLEDDGEGDEPDDLPPEMANMGNDTTSGGGDASKYKDAHHFIDGETYYRELLEIYRDDILNYLDAHGSEMTPEERAVIETYIGIV